MLNEEVKDILYRPTYMRRY